ncbi:MAG: hypothetical protein J7L96_09775, partial [Bacteroidales bacterium]|nr:hypothetical protein [Bacteroidales bacterium]
GALVGLFSSFDEWSMLENPVQVWKETNAEGKATFLNLQTLNYYIYAEKDSLNNMMNEIKTEKSLEVNVLAELEIHID